ncbi:hypothetical protein CHARACLAT_020110 [Characodon lateralis]|uniref:Uncharacterized protein n=1 Tax=Characodon lateralis TaxID=208331 RepID=A0ABU7CRZ0_9TELE|nr:hypothetical protein [Characodon lateralis]
MTPLDPVEELCLFASKKTLAHWASPVPVVSIVEETGCSKSGAFIWIVTTQEVRSYPFPGCVGSSLMQFILKVPEKSALAFHVVIMAVVPTFAKAILMLC